MSDGLVLNETVFASEMNGLFVKTHCIRLTTFDARDESAPEAWLPMQDRVSMRASVRVRAGEVAGGTAVLPRAPLPEPAPGRRAASHESVKSTPFRMGSRTYPEVSVIDGMLVATAAPTQSNNFDISGRAS
jgi:hypothetical protein